MWLLRLSIASFITTLIIAVLIIVPQQKNNTTIEQDNNNETIGEEIFDLFYSENTHKCDGLFVCLSREYAYEETTCTPYVSGLDGNPYSVQFIMTQNPLHYVGFNTLDCIKQCYCKSSIRDYCERVC